MKLLAFAWLFTATCYSQEFDAASIRPATPVTTQCKGGPGTDDPGRLTCQNFPLSFFVMMAYNLRAYQYQGPEWMSSTRFDVQATVPPGATVEQFRSMLQHMLAARFKLAIHSGMKEMDGYAMTVAKKSPNLKEVAPAATAEFPWRPPTWKTVPVRVKAQYTSERQPISALARLVSDQLNSPVADDTDLKGAYDFTIQWMYDPAGQGPAAVDDNGVSIGDALKEQLGLALVKKKVQVNTVIVDHSEKSPNDN